MTGIGRLPALIAMTATLGAASPPLRIVGYNDMDEMLGALTRAYTARHPDTRFVLRLESTRSGPPALLDDEADLAPMGAEMEPADRAAIAARWGVMPLEIPVAHDSLTPGTLSSPTGVFVHRTNPLRAISLRRLRRLMAASARPMAWQALGVRRPGRPRLMGLSPTTAIGRFVMRRLGTSGFAPGFRGYGQSRDVAAAIAADPDAIGFANLNHASPGIRALDLVDDAGQRTRPVARDIVSGRYPLDRRLLIYVRPSREGRIDPRVADFLAFVLSPAGQGIVAAGAKGYLPLSPEQRARALATVVRRPGRAASRGRQSFSGWTRTAP